ncbi:MAG: DUF3333 domain-containing protein, partial [Paracoccaceae bacterium]
MTLSLLQSDKRTRRRNAAEARFRAYGLGAIGVAALAIVILMASVLSSGLSGFRQTYITLDIALPEATLDKSGQRDPAQMSKVTTFGYAPLLRDALLARMAQLQIATDLPAKDIGGMISKEAAATLRAHVLANPDLVGGSVTLQVLAEGRIDGYFKGRVTMESAALDANTSPEAL